MSQAKVLYLVQASAPLGMSELAGRLGVDRVHGERPRRAARRGGPVDRRDDPADRRHVLLSLTDTGTASLDRMRELNTGHMRRDCSSTSPTTDLATIDRAIRALTEAAAEMASSPLPPLDVPAASAARKEPS